MFFGGAPVLIRGFALLILASLLSGEALAQRVLTVTTAMTATQEPASSLLESIDLGHGAPLPGGHALSGVHLAGAMSLLPPASPVATGGHAFVMSHGWPPGPIFPDLPFASALQLFQTSPFREKEAPLWYGTPGWSGELVGVLPVPDQRNVALAVILETADHAGERLFAGRLRVLQIGLDAEPPTIAESLLWELPGRPVAGALLASAFRVAILCEGPTGTLLATADMRDPEGEFAAVEAIPEGAIMGLSPSALTVQGDDRLLVFQSGYPSGARGSNPQTWLTIYDARSLTAEDDAIILNGVVDREQPAIVAGDERCWVATRLPGTYFAYITEIGFSEAAPLKRQELVINNVTESIRLATSPQDDRRLAVAMDNRVEIWPEARRENHNVQSSFATPVRQVLWGTEHVLVAEAGRIHRIDAASGAIQQTVQYQRGQIAHMMLIPEDGLPIDDQDGDGLSAFEERQLGTSPERPDSDNDGIHDGIDPSPNTINPSLELSTRQIVFRGAAAGKELRAFRIGPDNPDVVWRVRWDAQTMPWLRLQPQTGRGAGVAYLGVDPLHLSERGPSFGQITVELQSLRPGVTAWGSPAHLPVFVTPRPALPRKILWVWPTEGPGVRDGADPRRYRELAELTARAPHYFAHDEAVAPVLDPLAPYDIVTLPADAAARGALTRKALLDYVAGGGALLVLAGNSERDTLDVLSELLRPLGIDVSGATPANETAALADGGLGDAWAALGPKPSCSFRIAGSNPDLLSIEGMECGFVLRRYGYGRVALIGDPTVLQSRALGNEANALFAAGVMRWLARAGIEFNDLDGDGIPDEIEDLNGNGLHDLGETDFMHPDTDGDGVPDGLEDLNRNGKVDDGETDPRNPDSDSDGIRDGADRSPAPVYGAPHIDSIVPSEAPLEGGGTVIISGRNFLPGTQVWFGDRPAPEVQILSSGELSVVAPDGGDSPGIVEVRTAHARQESGARLPDAFRFLPRSSISLRLSEGRAASMLGGRMTGVIGVQLMESGNEDIQSLQFVLKVRDAQGFRWGNARPGTAIVPVGRQVTSRPLDAGEVLVLYRPPDGAVRRNGDLVRIPWSLDVQASTEGARVVEIMDAQALRANAARLEVQSTPLELSY